MISEHLRPCIFSCVKQTPVGFWHSALLKRGKLKDFQGTKPRSRPFHVRCLPHTLYFSSSPNVTATSLVIFWVSQLRRVIVVPPASPPTVPPTARVLHLSCRPTSSVVPRSGFSIRGWLLGKYLAQVVQYRWWYGLLQSSQCNFSLCLSSEPLWRSKRKMLERQDTQSKYLPGAENWTFKYGEDSCSHRKVRGTNQRNNTPTELQSWSGKYQAVKLKYLVRLVGGFVVNNFVSTPSPLYPLESLSSIVI